MDRSLKNAIWMLNYLCHIRYKDNLDFFNEVRFLILSQIQYWNSISFCLSECYLPYEALPYKVYVRPDQTRSDQACRRNKKNKIFHSLRWESKVSLKFSSTEVCQMTFRESGSLINILNGIWGGSYEKSTYFLAQLNAIYSGLIQFYGLICDRGYDPLGLLLLLAILMLVLLC